MGRRKRERKHKVPSVRDKSKHDQPIMLDFPRPETSARVKLTVVPHFPDDNPKSKIERSPLGGTGMYRVTFILSLPGKNVFREQLNFVELMQSGESLLQVPMHTPLAIILSNDTWRAEVSFPINKQGTIANAVMRVNAQSFNDAERTAYDLVSPQLSYWSYLYDVPIDVAGYELYEERTDTRMYFFGSIMGKVKPLALQGSSLSIPEYRRLFSAYREAMNTTNVFYQALSFYKITEGIRALRKRISRRDGISMPVYPDERLPDSADVLPSSNVLDELNRESFHPFLGQDFETVLDQFKELIRNAIAHLSQPDGVLDADHFDDTATCSRVIPVLKYIVREMLENEMTRLPK
jgi:hypothetical protein